MISSLRLISHSLATVAGSRRPRRSVSPPEGGYLDGRRPPRHIKRRPPLFGLLALLIVLTFTGCGGNSSSELTVMLDWFPWSNHTGLYRAQDAGYFEDEGLKVEIVVPSDPAAVLKIVGAGQADIGISYQTDVLQARAENVPVVSIAALVQHPLNSIMTLKESGITSPKQLEGKSLGTPGIPSNDAYLATMMNHAGGDVSKIEKVSVGFDLVPVLISKRVDAIIGAYWVHESIAAELQGHPVNIIRVEENGVPDYYELVLITNETMIRDNPETLRRFLRAVTRGYQDVMADHKMAIDLLMKVAPDTNRELEERGIELLAPLWMAEAPKFGWQEPERWRSYGQWMQANNLLKAPVDPDSAFTNEFLP